MAIDIKAKERFWSKVDRKGRDKCWNWLACRTGGGYGYFRVGNKWVRAHRVSWRLRHGPIPEGKLVLHNCDNKACINPGHLYLGTYSDNMFDRNQRDPQSLGGRGQRLTSEEDKEVVRLYSTGKFFQRQLAKIFGCSQPNISRILKVQKIIEGRPVKCH